jgi:hypothetical protein
MKKYTFIFAIGAMFALTACGSGSSTNESKDSTTVVVDTTAVSEVDTTSQSPVGGAADTQDGVEKPSLEQVK